ncbi:Ampd2 protein [Salpingoeca rosetta]|uniref:AMP deaminase n=1 Tax=Salpingoeca rosetta (strain ATCC 50818 / BSB-021) TaxID=946362 RepID=F2UD04_SALR5|nr:Ampd2 protein [Salpingoeca rosetta]EGD74499.1 Ampd2 protein [Salpingoeca rosetta]|eukprot:XP_004992756.1 Ampd2 protein [Salpingoeca rosetta]
MADKGDASKKTEEEKPTVVEPNTSAESSSSSSSKKTKDVGVVHTASGDVCILPGNQQDVYRQLMETQPSSALKYLQSGVPDVIEDVSDEEDQVSADEEEEMLQAARLTGDARYTVTEEKKLNDALLKWHAKLQPPDAPEPSKGSLSPPVRRRERLTSMTTIAPDLKEATSAVDFRRILLTRMEKHELETGDISTMIMNAVFLRQKYMRRSEQQFPSFVTELLLAGKGPSRKTAPSSSGQNLPKCSKVFAEEDVVADCLKSNNVKLSMHKGVFNLYAGDDEECTIPFYKYVDVKYYLRDLSKLLALINDGPTKSFSFRRIHFLLNKFTLHTMLNSTRELTEQKSVPHRDFYNIRKVDTHVHLSACMNQKHLLRFIKSKLKKCPDETVIHRDGKDLTLQQVFDSLNLTSYDLSIDTLDMHADQSTFHRFDRFNLKYNPIGESRLREIFLKTSNKIKGRYFAEVSRQVIDDLEESKYQMAEYRVSVYGRAPDELTKLGAWFCDNNMASDNVRWLIQVPRLYYVYKKTGLLDNFAQVLDNLFRPLFENTLNPEKDPKLAEFLAHVVGFDSVDDESKPERFPHTPSCEQPEMWDKPDNPSYSYYAYYTYANLSVLNKLRKAKGLNTFAFRPHSGEAGSIEHLVTTYLLSENISHGIRLRKAPVLQYLYYLCQVGLSVSPLSNNHLFLDYHKNPFPNFHAMGMNVTLSTDDPLLFHLSREPLIEEYSIASQVWRLSRVDVCEICANSVRISGFPAEFKRHWLGDHFDSAGPSGNNIAQSNVPDTRCAYRFETLVEELETLLELQEEA